MAAEHRFKLLAGSKKRPRGADDAGTEPAPKEPKGNPEEPASKAKAKAKAKTKAKAKA